MIETALHNALLDVPRAAAIWLALLTLAVVALTALPSRPLHRLPDDAERIRESARRRARLAAQARDLTRYAQEVAVAADRAEVNARRRRAEWLRAEAESDAAWRAFDAADADTRRLAAARALPVPRTPQTPSEYADRERFLHRTVTAACWRGELSVLDLSDAMAHRGGWDPRRHPVEQEAIVLRAVRDRALIAYRAAADRERTAWRAAENSAAASDHLRREARQAAERARRPEARRPEVRWAEARRSKARRSEARRPAARRGARGSLRKSFESFDVVTLPLPTVLAVKGICAGQTAAGDGPNFRKG